MGYDAVGFAMCRAVRYGNGRGIGLATLGIGRERRKKESSQATMGLGLRIFSMRRRKKIPRIAPATMLPRPNSRPGRDGTLLRHVRAGDEKKIIAADQHERKDQAGSAAAAARAHANGNSQEREDQAGSGESDAALEFDARVAPVRAAFGEKLGDGALGIGDGHIFRTGCRRWKLDGDVALAESSDVIVLGSLRVVFVGAAAAEMQFEFVVSGAGNHLGVLGDGHVGGGGFLRRRMPGTHRASGWLRLPRLARII